MSYDIRKWLHWPVRSTPAAWFCWTMVCVGAGFCLPVLIAELTVPLPPADDADDGN